MPSRAAPGMIRYELPDQRGCIQAVHVRIEAADGGKRFVWEQEDGSPGLLGRPVASLPLYGIWRLAQASVDTVVFVTEGEKAADALDAVGLLAVGTVTGAAATPDDDVLSSLTNREVSLWPDNDDVGRAHMNRIAARLLDLGVSVSVVEWSDAPPHGDAADFTAAGYGTQDVIELPIRSALLRNEAWAGWNSAGPIQSAQAIRPRGAQRIRFRTARELAAEMPADVDWIAKPWVAAGAITGIDGKIKAAGKTTLITHLCRAVLDGRRFLGAPTRKTRVVYLTEQPLSSLGEALRRADLLTRDDFVVMTWRDCAAVPWPEVVEQAVAECARRGAGLLVVDTLSRFAGIRGDGENRAGEAEAAMAPLQLAAADGLAVVVIRHERKAGGEVGDSGRGSSAFGGAVDILLAVRRVSAASTLRIIHALSRFDETPETLEIGLTPDGYVAAGDNADARADAAIRGVLPSGREAAWPLDRIVTESQIPRTTVQRSIERLVDTDRAVRVGAGVKGDPYRWCRPDSPGSDASASPGEPSRPYVSWDGWLDPEVWSPLIA